MCCKVRSGQVEDSGRFPCAECRNGVGVNSIACTRCGDWVHKRCSGVKHSLNKVVGFMCSRCVVATRDEEEKKEIEGRFRLPVYTGRMYGPYTRPVYTGALFDNRIYGPYIRLPKSAPVYTGRTYGPYRWPVQSTAYNPSMRCDALDVKMTS